MQTTITNARRDFTRLLRRVEGGDVVLLTRHGRPILELRAVPTPPQTEDERLNDVLREIVSPRYLDAFFEKQIPTLRKNPKYLRNFAETFPGVAGGWP